MFMASTGQRIEDLGAEDNDAIPWPAQGGHRRFGVSLRVSGRAGPPHAEAWTTCEAVRSPAFRLDSCADGGCARKALPKALGGSQNRKIGLKTPKMAILGLEPRFVAGGALLDFLHEAEGFGGAQRLAAFFEPHFFLEGFENGFLERVIAARGLDVRQIWRLRVVRLRHGPSGFRQAEALAFDRGAQGGERAMGGRGFLFDRIDRVDLRERAPQLLHGGASFRFGA